MTVVEKYKPKYRFVHCCKVKTILQTSKQFHPLCIRPQVSPEPCWGHGEGSKLLWLFTGMGTATSWCHSCSAEHRPQLHWQQEQLGKLQSCWGRGLANFLRGRNFPNSLEQGKQMSADKPSFSELELRDPFKNQTQPTEG